MGARVLLAQKPRSKKAVESALARAWEAELGPALSRLSHGAESKAAAAAALTAFLRRLEESGCLLSPGTASAPLRPSPGEEGATC
jgi:hypothetical protein